MCDQGCQSPTAPGCLNGGSFVEDDKKQTVSCLCKAPWIGKICENKLGKKRFQEQRRCIFKFYICTPHPAIRFPRQASVSKIRCRLRARGGAVVSFHFFMEPL